MALRKSQFWFDNSAGTLTDFSADLNSVNPAIAREVLDDTGLNDDYQQNAAVGLKTGSLAISGYIRAGSGASTGIIKALQAAYNTSVSKTFQWKYGSGHYLNGECISDGVNYGPADGKGLITWSCTLITDGTVNSTSVAL